MKSLVDLSKLPVTFIDKENVRDAKLLAERLMDLDTATAVDTEFDDNGDGTVNTVLKSLYVEDDPQGYVLTSNHIPLFKRWFESNRARLVYQNYKADFAAIAQYDINTHPSFYADTMVMSWFHDENQRRHGLKAQALTWLKWKRAEYSELFSYVAIGMKQRVVMTPTQIMYDLPEGAVAEYAIRQGIAKPEDVAHLKEIVKDDRMIRKAREWWRGQMIRYSGDDAISTMGVFVKHRRYLKEIGYWSEYLKHDRAYTLTLLRCEERGTLVDRERLLDIKDMVDVRLMQALRVFQQAAEDPDFNPNSDVQLRKLLIDKWKWPVNPNYLTEKKREPQMGREAMEWWSEQGLAMADVKLEYNNASTMRGTFLVGILEGLSDDERLRSDFKQLGAVSGRISSRKRVITRTTTKVLKSGKVKTWIKKFKVGANVQNIPSRKEKDPYGIRRAFRAPRIGEMTAWGKVAKEEHAIICADYSGFELVMVIHWISQIGVKSPMLDAMVKYGSPSSVHAYTAIKLYKGHTHICDARCMAEEFRVKGHNRTHVKGRQVTLGEIPMDAWTTVKSYFPDEYSIAKNNNFNLLYGGGAKMMARLRGMDPNNPRDVQECREQIIEWNRIYPEVKRYQNYMIEHGVEHGWIPTIGGRRCNVENLLSGKTAEGYPIKDAERKLASIEFGKRTCTNRPSQGSAADIVKVAMNLCEADEELRSYRCALMFPVHDELLFEVPKRFAEKALERVLVLMKKPYREKMKFDLSVEGKISDNWLDAK